MRTVGKNTTNKKMGVGNIEPLTSIPSIKVTCNNYESMINETKKDFRS